jgi:hypothetical protein
MRIWVGRGDITLSALWLMMQGMSDAANSIRDDFSSRSEIH